MGGSPVNSSDMRSYYERHDYFGGDSYYYRGSSIKTTPKRSVADASQVFTETKMRDEFNPAKIKLPREACDSAASPKSRGIILAEDVTGSTGKFLLELIQKQIPKIIENIYEIVSYNPHILCMGIGDVAAGDEAPLQVTQFETDLRIIEQLTKIWLEKCGGGNSYESYILAWYFAAKYCKMDCYDKRGEKGFLFTFGDEEPTPELTPAELKYVFGKREDLDTRRVTATDCLDMASEKFYCYHIILRGYNYTRETARKWHELMDGHFCDLSDYKCLPELVCAILKMYEGYSKTDVINGIQDSYVRGVVTDALKFHEEHVVDVSKKAENDQEIEIF